MYKQGIVDNAVHEMPAGRLNQIAEKYAVTRAVFFQRALVSGRPPLKVEHAGAKTTNSCLVVFHKALSNPTSAVMKRNPVLRTLAAENTTAPKSRQYAVG